MPFSKVSKAPPNSPAGEGRAVVTHARLQCAALGAFVCHLLLLLLLPPYYLEEHVAWALAALQSVAHGKAAVHKPFMRTPQLRLTLLLLPGLPRLPSTILSPLPPGAGFSGTDHVYYITAKKTASCGDNTIAYTIICHMEAFTFRPNVASINLCPRFWTLGEPLGSKQISALVHEMIHGLVSAACVPAHLICQGRFCSVLGVSIRGVRSLSVSFLGSAASARIVAV